MFSLLLTLLFSLFFINSCLSTCECEEESQNCIEEPTYFEMQCSTSLDGNLVIQIQQQKQPKILIQCIKLFSLDLEEFPYIPTNTTITEITMESCPWMLEPFYKILGRFFLHRIESLEVTTSDIENVTITAKSFVRLSDLQQLKLTRNKIRNLDENVFVHTPNLTYLDLQDNNIILTKNLFKTVLKLQFLDLSQNNLSRLPVNIFQPLKHLKILQLWGNKFTKLNELVLQDFISLHSFEMSHNKLQEVSPQFFRRLPNLKEVSLSDNKIKTLPWTLFRDNKRLKRVRMPYNFGLVLPDYFFANSTAVEVDFKKCNLQSLPRNVFENAQRLEKIVLSYNNLTVLPEGVFEGLKNLKKLFLENNKIESVTGIFRDLHQLEILNLQNNLIRELLPEDFIGLTNLTHVMLQRNRIQQIHPELFANKINLIKISLSFNNIETPLDKIIPFEDTPSLVDLDVKNNKISTVKLACLNSVPKVIVKLDYNNVTTVDFSNLNKSTTAKISLKNNPITCDCLNYDLHQYFKYRKTHRLVIFPRNLKCASPSNLKKKSLSALTVQLRCPLNQLSKNHNPCPYKCDCSWTPSDKSILIDCSYRNFTEFPHIDLSHVDFVEFNQTEGRFQGNNLRAGPRKSQGYDNMTKLILSHNQIREIDWLPPKLEVLALDHNHVTNLKEKVVQTLNSSLLVALYLNDNPWVCDCGSVFLANFLRLSTNLISNVTDAACINRPESLLNLKKADVCQSLKIKHIIPIILFFLLIIAVMIALYYRYQKPIKIWLFSKNLCLRWITEEELDKDKTYDAFISYSHKDTKIVANLVKNLETPPSQYKLCLHYRDWIPGEFITNQITNSVVQSRRTIVILSDNFLESVWGKMEFRMAHTIAMSDRQTRVIIILYGDVEVNSLDEELKMYLKTNTYLKWGDPYFWEKLKYALPHKLGRNGCKVTNMTRCNEKINLINEGPSSPGSTPPISSHPSFAKINPLSLIDND